MLQQLAGYSIRPCGDKASRVTSQASSHHLPWQGSTTSVSNPFGSELLWISVSVTAYLLYNNYDQGWQKMLQTFVKVPLYSSRAGAISSTACTGLHILFLLKRYPNLMSV